MVKSLIFTSSLTRHFDPFQSKAGLKLNFHFSSYSTSGLPCWYISILTVKIIV